jgi:hypothetical protein
MTVDEDSVASGNLPENDRVAIVAHREPVRGLIMSLLPEQRLTPIDDDGLTHRQNLPILEAVGPEPAVIR